MKSIEINIKEWRDKTYGNTYFSARVYIDGNEDGQATLYIPFQYGNGSHAEDVCHKEIQKVLNFPNPNHHYKQTCNINGFYYSLNIQEGCKKKQTKEWGIQS